VIIGLLKIGLTSLKEQGAIILNTLCVDLTKILSSIALLKKGMNSTREKFKMLFLSLRKLMPDEIAMFRLKASIIMIGVLEKANGDVKQ